MATTEFIIGVYLIAMAIIGIFFVFFSIFKEDLITLARYKIVKRTIGFILVGIGIFGLFAPIIPGILFLIWGLALLENVYIKKVIEGCKVYFKKKFS